MGKEEMSHEDETLIELQDRTIAELRTENARLWKRLEQVVGKHGHDHEYWHDDCGLCQADKQNWEKLEQVLKEQPTTLSLLTDHEIRYSNIATSF